MPIPTQGPVIAAFLRNYFAANPVMKHNLEMDDKPEYELGVTVLSRPELNRLASVIGETFRRNPDGSELGALQMVPYVEEWLMDGRFDHLAKGAQIAPMPAPADALRMRTLERENISNAEEIRMLKQALKDLVNSKTSPEAMERIKQFADEDTDVVENDAPEEFADVIVPKDEAQLRAMSKQQVRSLAKSLNINIRGRSHEEMINDVLGLPNDANAA